jgi:hypothetical protein
MLPWVVDSDGGRSGVSQPDGLLTLMGGAVALALAWRRVAIGWIVSGFFAVLLGRDILTLTEVPSARPGAGLWVGASAFAAAAVVQFVELVRSRRTAAGMDGG